MATQNTTPQDDEFVTISEEVTEPEIKIVFDTIGDQFTGIYLGMRQQESYQQARFADLEDASIIYFVNANYSLKNGLRDARVGEKVRITFSSETDTGQANPMRNYTVEVARRKVSGMSNVRRASQGKPSS